MKAPDVPPPPSEPPPPPQSEALPAALAVQPLHPGNFAAVMASGIIAVGFSLLGYPLLAELLAVAALGGWGLLLLLSLLRLLRYPRVVGIDLRNPRMVFAYFTLVAATSIVGMLMAQHGQARAAMACWALAFLACARPCGIIACVNAAAGHSGSGWA